MNDSESQRPEPSLAMRRAGSERARVIGLTGVVVGGLYLLMGISLLVQSAKTVYGFQILLGVGILAFGVWRYWSARRDIRKLDATDDPEAGDQ